MKDEDERKSFYKPAVFQCGHTTECICAIKLNNASVFLDDNSDIRELKEVQLYAFPSDIIVSEAAV